MSKGTKTTTVRIPSDLEEKLTQLLIEYNAKNDFQQPMTKTDFILQAIAEKCSKTMRGRRKKGNIVVDNHEPGFARKLLDTFDSSCWDSA